MSEIKGGYKRASGATRCNKNTRGFRVNNIRRLSIQRLRVRFLHFFKILFKWRKLYEQAIKSFKKGVTFTGGVKTSSCNSKNNNANTINNTHSNNNNNNNNNNNFIKTQLITEEKRRSNCRLRSLARNNSFYTEAIADCLEFIKRNSLSVDVEDPHIEVTPIAAYCP